VLAASLEKAGPGTGLAFGDRRIIDASGHVIREAPSRYEPTDKHQPLLDVLTCSVFVPATGVLYRRSVFGEIGGFDERIAL
jgi:GT2 family glycosyltransferase